MNTQLQVRSLNDSECFMSNSASGTTTNLVKKAQHFEMIQKSLFFQSYDKRK